MDMIDAAGRICQMIGLPRSTGQVYGLLYLSVAPLSLDDIARLLSISKSSASTGTRQLLGWRVIKQVWVQGDRRDFFEVEPDLGNLLRAGYTDFLRPRLDSSKRRLKNITSTLDTDLASGSITQEEHKLCRERLEHFHGIHKQIEALIPLVDRFL